MSQLEYTIMGQIYMLTCPEGAEEKMSNAVAHVDQTMCRIRDSGKLKQRDRIAVLAALNLCFELETSKGQLAQAVQTFENLEIQALEANRQIRELEDALYQTTAQLEAVQAQLSAHLHSLAAVQVEQLANAFDLHHEEIPENNLNLDRSLSQPHASAPATAVTYNPQASLGLDAHVPGLELKNQDIPTLSEANSASAALQAAQAAQAVQAVQNEFSGAGTAYTAEQERALSILNRLDGVLEQNQATTSQKDVPGYHNGS